MRNTPTQQVKSLVLVHDTGTYLLLVSQFNEL